MTLVKLIKQAKSRGNWKPVNKRLRCDIGLVTCDLTQWRQDNRAHVLTSVNTCTACGSRLPAIRPESLATAISGGLASCHGSSSKVSAVFSSKSSGYVGPESKPMGTNEFWAATVSNSEVNLSAIWHSYPKATKTSRETTYALHEIQ